MYERAVLLQDQLDHVHRPPQLLLEVLEISVQEQPFYLFVDRLASHNSPHAFYQNCRLAIQKHAQHSGKASFTYLAAASKPATYGADTSENVPNLDRQRSHTNLTVKSYIAKALYAKSVQRYKYNNRAGPRKRMNSKHKDGSIRKCRGCGSIWHFIRDCKKVKKVSLVNLVLELLTLADPHSLSMNQKLDTIQDLPDDV